MTPEQAACIQAYLDSLEQACADLQPSRRNELVGEIRAHIEESLADFDNVDDADLRGVLDALGSPDDIAAAARADEIPQHATKSAANFSFRDISTVVLLLVGAVLAGVGWVVGALLLWTSPSWRTRDKLIGTFLVPGGLVGAAILVGLGTVVAGQSCVSTSSGPTRCTGFALPPAVGVPMIFVLLLGPIFSMIWLVRTHRASRVPIAADASVTSG